MIKILAKIYLILLLISYAFFLSSSFESIELWLHPLTWLQWFINSLCIYALMSYIFSFRIIVKNQWMIILFLMLVYYSYHFTNLNIFGAETLFVTKMTVLVNYLFLVFPSIVCVAYLSFRKEK